MGIGFSIFLLALGAILAFALDFTVVGVDISVIGWILMAAGVIGLILTMVVLAPRRRRTVTETTTTPADRRTPASSARSPRTSPDGPRRSTARTHVLHPRRTASRRRDRGQSEGLTMTTTRSRWIRSAAAVAAGALIAVTVPALVATHGECGHPDHHHHQVGLRPDEPDDQDRRHDQLHEHGHRRARGALQGDDRLHLHREAAGRPADEDAVLHVDGGRQLPVLRSEPA